MFVDDLDAPGPDRRRSPPPRAGAPPPCRRRSHGHRRCAERGGGAGSARRSSRPARSQVDPPPAPTITVAFALVKGERPELVVQKLTELGVDRIVPFLAERSVVRWEPDKAERNATRLRRVAVEAAMQCRRTWLPEVAALATFDRGRRPARRGRRRPWRGASEPRSARPCSSVPRGAGRPRSGRRCRPSVGLSDERSAGRDRSHHRGEGAVRADGLVSSPRPESARVTPDTHSGRCPRGGTVGTMAYSNITLSGRRMMSVADPGVAAAAAQSRRSGCTERWHRVTVGEEQVA